MDTKAQRGLFGFAAESAAGKGVNLHPQCSWMVRVSVWKRAEFDNDLPCEAVTASYADLVSKQLIFKLERADPCFGV